MRRSIELGTRHPKPDPIDIRVDDRPTISVPPAVVGEPPVDEFKIGTHGSLSHVEDPARAVRCIAEELWDAQPCDNGMKSRGAVGQIGYQPRPRKTVFGFRQEAGLRKSLCKPGQDGDVFRERYTVH